MEEIYCASYQCADEVLEGSEGTKYDYIFLMDINSEESQN